MDKVLRPKFAQAFEDYGVWLLVLTPLSLLLLPVLVITLLTSYSEVVAFYGALLEKDNFFNLILPVIILLPLFMGFVGVISRARVELSETGIRFVSGLPGFLAEQADWELRWDEMESVALKAQPISHALTAAIQVHPHRGPGFGVRYR
jgi:hypothetical protein